MATTCERRLRAESIIATIHATTQTGTGSPSTDEQATALAERLEVLRALIWLAVDQLDVDDIDALVAWWPRKDGV